MNKSLKHLLLGLFLLARIVQAGPPKIEKPWAEFVQCLSGDNFVGRSTAWVELRGSDGLMLTLRMHARSPTEQQTKKFVLIFPDGVKKTLTKEQEGLMLNDLLPLWEKLPGSTSETRERVSTRERVTADSFRRILEALRKQQGG